MTRNPRTPTQFDEYGNPTIYGTTDNDSDTSPIDGRITEALTYGVLNGSFGRGPADPNHDITDINPMSDWTGPVSVSGGAITAQWVADTGSPSGYNLRFTINPGAANDESYFEQKIPIGGSRARWTQLVVWAYAIAGAANTTTFRAKLDASTLDVNGNVVDTLGFDSNDLAAGTEGAIANETGRIGATATQLRIRIGVVRTGAASASGTIDFSEVRAERSQLKVYLNDADPTYAFPGQLSQSSGQITLRAGNGGAEILMDAAGGTIGFSQSSPPTASGATGYSDSGATVVHSAGTFTGGVGSTAYTIGDLVKILKNIGLIAS
jgi:hypothetical protein